MTRSAFLHSLSFLILLAASDALAQPTVVAERYSTMPASADGIGKRYM